MDPGFSTLGSLTLPLSKGAPSIVSGNADDAFTYRWEHKDDGSGFINANFQHYWSRSINLNDPDNNNYRWTAIMNRLKIPPEQLPLPVLKNGDETLKSAHDEPVPFLSVTIGLRTLNNLGSAATDKPLPRGYRNTKLIFPGTGIDNTVSAEENPYEWEFFSPNEWADTTLPHTDETAYDNSDDHGGYVGSSFQTDQGFSRWIVAELPTQPVLSLGELQHFDISLRNTSPPRIANAIGNSLASPYIAPEEAIISGNVASNDHSYVSNHILFDDWFLSSITPDYTGFTQVESRSIEEVYADHLSLTTPLRNRQYLPASPTTPSSATSIASTALSDPMVWHTIASTIEVEGMFNINSTSIEAWKALLMSQRNSRISYSESDTTSWETKVSATPGTPFGRTTVVGSTDSSSDDGRDLLASYLTMNDDEIEALATAIVAQIKQRGPFLSLSEFVNRQLRDDNEDLALAGTIEAALLSLKTGSHNPFEDILDANPEVATVTSPLTTLFPLAAQGSAVYGMPGWTTQADVLRAIAPIISARDDTFKIRTYGSAKDPITGDTLAEAWCEAIVQRKADYVDPSNSPTENINLSDMNKQYGRKFHLISFRWLLPDEV